MNWKQTLRAAALAALAAFLAAFGVRFSLPSQPAPPTLPTPPEQPAKPEAGPDAPAAIGRIQFGNAGCTATVIGPRRPDGRWLVLTASHCVEAVGQQGSMRLLDGRTTALQVVALDRTSDCCWCVTTTNSEVFPFALLAATDPQPGESVWHAGFGFDRPGNREEGEVRSAPNDRGQLHFWLNVSSGDSGGGICTNAKGEVVSCVCCTTSIANKADVWGASVAAIRKLRPGPGQEVFDIWKPIPVPNAPPQLMPK